ncbi:MAG: SPW repeat domain-containing protein, partial [Gemmatimonadaceae bacterium]
AAAVRRLAEHVTVVGFDREGDPNPPFQAECVCVDVTSDESVRNAFARLAYAYGNRIASVIHLAAYYDFSGEPSPKYEEVTVRGTERLLHALREFRVEQFVFSSTILVHAPSAPGKPLTEGSPLDPKWDYPRSKVETEQLIRAQHGDIPVVLLRIAGVYDEWCHSLPIAHQIQRIYERQLTSHVFPGDPGRGRQSFVHLDDLVDAFELLVRRRAELGSQLVLLVGEEEAMSFAELQHAIGCLVHGEEWETHKVPERLAEVAAYVQDKLPAAREPFIKPWMVPLAEDDFEVDNTRARATLGWEPRHRLRDALPQIVAKLKADPVRWYRENKLAAPEWLAAEKRAAPEAGDSAAEREEAAAKPEGAKERKSHNMGAGKPHGGQHGRMQEEHHEQMLWAPLLVVVLGAWLISSPFTLGYANPDLSGASVERITAMRDLAPFAARGAAMLWSDIASGTLLIVFGFLSLNARRLWAPWGASLVAVWLLFAPLVLWAPNAGAYNNATIIGALVIALAILIPGMPGMMTMMQPGPEIPPGWSYNPSAWLQRAPIIALGWVGFFLARHLTAYQLGYVGTAWDPVFGDQTMRILDSDVSRAWPISDAGLGTAAYAIEALMGYMGGSDRWRTMPWMVTFFGILVIPLGTVSIFLVIMQPVAVGAWCTLCLVTALAMLIMIPLTLDEVVAMLQFLAQSRREGKSLWHTFWMGGTVGGGNKDQRTPPFTAPLRESAPAMVWGTTLPWTLGISAALGLWVMASPAVFGVPGSAAGSHYIAGALVTTVAVIATAEVGRALRFVNVLLGVWIASAAWTLGYASSAARWSGLVVGLAVIALSIPRGAVRERYGTWARTIV